MSRTILLVDDERWWAEYFRHLLVQKGYKCVLAQSIDTALESLDEYTYDAIVLDFLLADANVMQLLHELQSYNDTYTIPIIICTNLEIPKEQVEALETYGVRMVLNKATMLPWHLIGAVKAVII